MYLITWGHAYKYHCMMNAVLRRMIFYHCKLLQLIVTTHMQHHTHVTSSRIVLGRAEEGGQFRGLINQQDDFLWYEDS